MGADMRVRMLYQRANTALDKHAAREAIRRLVNQPTPKEFADIVAEYDIQVLYPDDDAASRLDLIENLDHQVDRLLESLDNYHEVTMHTIGGVWVYITGGPTWGDAPTEAYGAWDLLFEDRIPEDWGTEIGRALGLLYPEFERDSTTINFVRW